MVWDHGLNPPLSTENPRDFCLFAILAECFAILFEALLIEIQEEIPHFAGWEGGVNGHKNCEQNFCEPTIRIVRATDASKRVLVQLKAARFLCYRRVSSPYGAIGSPYGPSVPLTGPLLPLRGLLNCLLVGHSPQALLAYVRWVPLRTSVLAGPRGDCWEQCRSLLLQRKRPPTRGKCQNQGRPFFKTLKLEKVGTRQSEHRQELVLTRGLYVVSKKFVSRVSKITVFLKVFSKNWNSLSRRPLNLWLKTTFDMTTLIFSTGGVPLVPFLFL